MNSDFDLKSYEYELSLQQIAQVPAAKREQSRLLVLDCRNDSLKDMKFIDILSYFNPGDLLVVNDTKVFPARLEGRKSTGGKVELFLLEYPDFNQAQSGRESDRLRENGKIKSIEVIGLLNYVIFNSNLEAKIMQYLDNGKVLVKLSFDLSCGFSPEKILQITGRIPLPPYIQRNNGDLPEDRDRYQTLFAQKSGAIAAPTAGLHFSETLLIQLEERNIRIVPITLHIGYGTFAPVRVNDIRDHKIHEEYVEVSPETAKLINQTRASGKRIWAVGTTTVRTLEFAANAAGLVEEKRGWCGLYIYPGYKFKVVNGLITNFHLPGSSLLFLVAALAGRSRVLHAYERAIQLGFRFYSYGDAMLIICG